MSFSTKAGHTLQNSFARSSSSFLITFFTFAHNDEGWTISTASISIRRFFRGRAGSCECRSVAKTSVLTRNSLAEKESGDRHISLFRNLLNRWGLRRWEEMEGFVDRPWADDFACRLLGTSGDHAADQKRATQFSKSGGSKLSSSGLGRRRCSEWIQHASSLH